MHIGDHVVIVPNYDYKSRDINKSISMVLNEFQCFLLWYQTEEIVYGETDSLI